MEPWQWKKPGQPGDHRAIDACAQNGGGRFICRGGLFERSIHLKSKINLFLDAAR